MRTWTQWTTWTQCTDQGSGHPVYSVHLVHAPLRPRWSKEQTRSDSGICLIVSKEKPLYTPCGDLETAVLVNEPGSFYGSGGPGRGKMMGQDPRYGRGVFRFDPDEPAWLSIPTAVVVIVLPPVMDLRTTEPEEAGL